MQTHPLLGSIAGRRHGSLPWLWELEPVSPSCIHSPAALLLEAAATMEGGARTAGTQESGALMPSCSSSAEQLSTTRRAGRHHWSPATSPCISSACWPGSPCRLGARGL